MLVVQNYQFKMSSTFKEPILFAQVTHQLLHAASSDITSVMIMLINADFGILASHGHF